MTAKQHADWQNYHTLSTFFDEENDIVEAFDILKEDVAAFKTLLDAIDAKIEEIQIPPSVTSADRTALKRQMANTARNVLIKLKAHAVKTRNTGLEQFCKPSLSSIIQMEESEFVRFMSEVSKRLTTHAEAMAKYNITEEHRLAFSQNIEKYAPILPQIKVINSKASVNVDNLSALFKQTKEFIDCVLAAAVDSVVEIHPDFVKAFNEVRTGHTPTISYTQIIVKVVDEATQEPLDKANIHAAELDEVFTSNEEGKCIIRAGSNRAITLKISKLGWKAAEMTVSKIIRGRTREVTIALLSEAVLA